MQQDRHGLHYTNNYLMFKQSFFFFLENIGNISS